jgi:hypothetical protein
MLPVALPKRNLQTLQRLSAFFNGFPIFLNGFLQLLFDFPQRLSAFFNGFPIILNGFPSPAQPVKILTV